VGVFGDVFEDAETRDAPSQPAQAISNLGNLFPH
jgi:hypothetical protein